MAKPTIWGRANSINVQKVLWCCAELGLDYDRIDAGMQFGRTKEPEYLAMNPNARVPTLVDGDFVLWESHSIMRYLAQQYGAGGELYPQTIKPRASVDRWLDWVLGTLLPTDRDVFWGMVRTPPEKRDMAAMQKGADQVAELWRIVDRHLAGKNAEGKRFIEGDHFTLADLVLGCYGRRWFDYQLTKPALPNLETWYRQLETRVGFETYIAPPLT
ncbi:MAG TPA: glutathione S-transferase [Stellaceae bacterium]|nr:glutathione S-transferase [Stellaceae bacterium]